MVVMGSRTMFQCKHQRPLKLAESNADVATVSVVDAQINGGNGQSNDVSMQAPVASEINASNSNEMSVDDAVVPVLNVVNIEQPPATVSNSPANSATDGIASSKMVSSESKMVADVQSSSFGSIQFTNLLSLSFTSEDFRNIMASMDFAGFDFVQLLPNNMGLPQAVVAEPEDEKKNIAHFESMW